MIKLTRIDDRLLHGQVAFTWVPSLGIDCLIIANDKVAKDEFQKMTLTLAKPPSAKLLIKSIADTVLFLNDPRSASLKILILLNSVQDASMLAQQVSEIRSINFGGIRTREGAKSISKAVAVTKEDIALTRQLLDKGIELEVRQVPSDSKQLLQTLI
jgi:fructoselysine and glucoselysine-specific PTS system IIB component